MPINLIYGTNGNNRGINTSSGDDIVFALGGDDIIRSSFGADVYDGGSGIDSVSFSQSSGVAGDLSTGVFVSDGTKNLVNIENVYGSDFVDTIFGNVLNNEVNGGKGSDNIFGGAGNDILRSGAGYYHDVLMGGTGDDELHSSVYGGTAASYRLASSAVFVDTYLGVATGGDGNDTLFGIHEIIGSTHADTLIAGLAGAVMRGGSGADLIRVTDARAITTSLYGENDNDTIYGGRSSTLMDGGRGVDFLYAGSGRTEMYGGIGADTLVAGDSADKMNGGSGGDRFVFRKSGDIDYTGDIILDFRRSEGDKIDLATIDANPQVSGDQSFEFVGANNFTRIGQLSYEAFNSSTVSGIQVELNLDRDSLVEARFVVANVSAVSAADFIL